MSEAAKGLLAAALDHGAGLLVAQGLSPHHFKHDDHRELFSILTGPHLSGGAVSLPVLNSEIAQSISNSGKRRRLIALAGSLVGVEILPFQIPQLAAVLKSEHRDLLVEAAAGALVSDPKNTEARNRLSVLLKEDTGNENGMWPPAIDFAELSSKEPAPPKFIMKDWLPCGYATLFAGHGGIGKSGLALVLAVCIALGIPFFGMAVERRRVMYLSCEDREGVLHWRLARICAFLEVTLAELTDWLTVLDLVGHNTILYQPKATGSALTAAYHQLEARMRSTSTQLLMIDGISDTYDGNENARAEVKAYVNSMLALIPPEDGAVILIGHVGKPATEQRTSEGYSGSTGWHNSVRARWYLYPETRKEEGGRSERTGSLVLELQKSNLGPTDGSFRFAWDEGAGMFVGNMDQGESHFDRNYREREEQDGILAALRTTKVPVPAAASGQRTAFHVLSVQESFPQSLLCGTPERKRFWRHIEKLRAMGEIVEDFITRPDRHKMRVLVLKGQVSQDCGHAGNVEYQQSPHNERTPPCGHAGNAAGGYKGGCAPVHSPQSVLPGIESTKPQLGLEVPL